MMNIIDIICSITGLPKNTATLFLGILARKACLRFYEMLLINNLMDFRS
jgi:hypothetical protein